jgi:hypothetical protein
VNRAKDGEAGERQQHAVEVGQWSKIPGSSWECEHQNRQYQKGPYPPDQRPNSQQLPPSKPALAAKDSQDQKGQEG